MVAYAFGPPFSTCSLLLHGRGATRPGASASFVHSTTEHCVASPETSARRLDLTRSSNMSCIAQLMIVGGQTRGTGEEQLAH